MEALIAILFFTGLTLSIIQLIFLWPYSLVLGIAIGLYIFVQAGKGKYPGAIDTNKERFWVSVLCSFFWPLMIMLIWACLEGNAEKLESWFNREITK